MRNEVDIAAKKKRIMHGKYSRLEERRLREIRILSLIAQGLSNEDIADILYISVITLERNIHRIKRTTGIHNRVLLALYAYSQGYVTTEAINAAIQAEIEREKE